MDAFRIDSHKLIYHPRRVADWLAQNDAWPIYIEISPTSACNHRCIFCAFDYLGHTPRFLDPKILKRFLNGISRRGVKSVLFSGEGETLLYAPLADMAAHAKKRGLDAAVTTNGVLLSKETARALIPQLTWLRVSLNAGTAKTYTLVHGAGLEDFPCVIQNIRGAVAVRNASAAACAIGVQFLLLKENRREAATLAEILSDTGIDYFSVKPYSQHPLSINRLKDGLEYGDQKYLERRLRIYERPDFKIIFRKDTMTRLINRGTYEKCYGTSFAAHLTTEGDLYGCSAFLGDPRFCFGNIYRETFERIWRGVRRAKVLKMLAESWDMAKCREVCRLDAVNRYLWELKHPPAHVNFI